MTTRKAVNDFVTGDRRHSFFADAITFIAYEQIPGDIAEFGVYGGRTLLMMARLLATNPFSDIERRLVGFDSFEGLIADTEGHARWDAGDCAINRDAVHPTLNIGDRVTPDAVRRLFDLNGLPHPQLEIGWFSESLPRALPSLSDKLALVHIDCDQYDATVCVLEHIAPRLQPGTLMIFDDWFHYRGDPSKGEARAFGEFLARHPQWRAIPYRPYAVFGNSFIMHRSEGVIPSFRHG